MKNIFNYFKNIITKYSFDIGIDLGTANTIVINKNYEILFNEPSVVCFDEKANKIIALGHQANNMIGRTPEGIKTIKPLKDGVIQYFDITHFMIKEILTRIMGASFFIHPRLVIGVPSKISDVEKRAVMEASHIAGARETILVEEALCAAVGMGIDISSPKGHFIIDIGGGTTEIAVISLNGIVLVNTVKLASEAIDSAILSYIKKEKELIIGEKTAEQIKINIGSLLDSDDEIKKTKVKGRNTKSGLPQETIVSCGDIRPILENIINNLLEHIKNTLENTPPELSGDIYERGIILSGGGALLKGLDEYISKSLNLPVILSPNPLLDVAFGTIKLLNNRRDII